MTKCKITLERGDGKYIPRGLYVHFGNSMSPVIYFRKPKWVPQSIFDEIMADIEMFLAEPVVNKIEKMASVSQTSLTGGDDG